MPYFAWGASLLTVIAAWAAWHFFRPRPGWAVAFLVLFVLAEMFHKRRHGRWF